MSQGQAGIPGVGRGEESRNFGTHEPKRLKEIGIGDYKIKFDKSTDS
jgi:hypothetical protein